MNKECDNNGCIVINNDIIVTMPPVGNTISYNLPFEKPCFFINNNLISPIKKNYDLSLLNPLTIEKYDIIKIKIKIPKQIFGIKYGYSLDYFASKIIYNNDFKAGLHIKSASGYYDIDRCICSCDELTIDDYCGWININIIYKVLEEEICNIRNISYSLCFEPIKLESLYGICSYYNDKEEIDVLTETYLELTKTKTKRKTSICFNICDSNMEKINVDIIGSSDLNCVILKQDNILSVKFNKFLKTLTISGDFKNSVNSDILKNKIEKYSEFYLEITNSYNLCYPKFLENITNDKFLTEIIN